MIQDDPPRPSLLFLATSPAVEHLLNTDTWKPVVLREGDELAVDAYFLNVDTGRVEAFAIFAEEPFRPVGGLRSSKGLLEPCFSHVDQLADPVVFSRGDLARLPLQGVALFHEPLLLADPDLVFLAAGGGANDLRNLQRAIITARQSRRKADRSIREGLDWLRSAEGRRVMALHQEAAASSLQNLSGSDAEPLERLPDRWVQTVPAERRQSLLATLNSLWHGLPEPSAYLATVLPLD